MNKKERAQAMDPRRFKINKSLALFPGGPENNNAMNVTSIADAPVQADSIMGDHRQQYPQMGTAMVNPERVPRSNVPTMPQQAQPAANSQEPMEGMRLGMDAQSRGLNSSSFMGVTGSGALMPGALDPQIPGTGVSLNMMPTTQQVVGSEMIPGSTPQKIQKKGKK